MTADSNSDAIVVGAGPSGLMAAIAAARRGFRVTVCEQQSEPGRRLLATGGGRCNLTNTCSAEEMMRRFGRQGRFAQPAFSSLDGGALRRFFADLGVPTHAPDGAHVFPQSEAAADILGALVRECRRCSVRFLLGAAVDALEIRNDGIAGVRIAGSILPARGVILAAGGCAWPQLGGGRTGYVLAQQAGHAIVEPVPALAPLRLQETWTRTCAGVVLPRARLRIDLPRQTREETGELLFTHNGISGPAALDLSAEVAALLRRHPKVPLRLQPLAGIGRAEWSRRLTEWRQTRGARLLRNVLDQDLPASLARALCSLAGADGITVAQMSRDHGDRLMDLVQGLPLSVTETADWSQAMAARGGVRLREVDPQSLQSRLVNGLHFCGEILDLDGPCGGFNLQWAFSSGFLVGSCVCI